MTLGNRNTLARIVACFLLMTAAAKPANAGSIPTKSDVVLIGVAIGAVGAGIGVGIYYAVRHSHNVTGCAASGASGLQLQSPGDQQTYTLIGDVAAIKPGERVRVSGKKEKKGPGSSQQFLVEKLTKDYGLCQVSPASP